MTESIEKVIYQIESWDIYNNLCKYSNVFIIEIQIWKLFFKGYFHKECYRLVKDLYYFDYFTKW